MQPQHAACNIVQPESAACNLVHPHVQHPHASTQRQQRTRVQPCQQTYTKRTHAQPCRNNMTSN
eukprot:9226886-Alexandrium_andersonii.AAC.1